MILSVLIPVVPSRVDIASDLFDRITAQAEGYDVEVLMLLDNKKRSVGLKRDALVQISRGDYAAFVDDDDDVAENYIKSIVDHAHLKMDVIVFDTLVSINGEPGVICKHAADYPIEQYNPNGFRRPPWMMHAWRGDLARATHFRDSSPENCEDGPWCAAMLKGIMKSVKINEVLYHYRYNHETTEASK